MTGSVGIFWGIPGPRRDWSIVTDATSLARAEPYGDFLTHPRGHYEVWSKWQTQSAAVLARQAIPPEISYHEYEDFPRGRIVYNVTTGIFLVYADRRLQHPEVIGRIAALFALPPGAFAVRSDAHYRC